jgi:integrase
MPRRRPEDERPRKRTYGTGTVAKRRDGSWQAQLPRGADPRRRATYHATKAAAEAWVAAQLERYARGLGLHVDCPSFGAYLDDWLDRPRDEGTDRAYRTRRRHLAILDDVPLDAIRPSHVERVMAEMRRKTSRFGTPLSARYVRLVVGLLSSVLIAAVRDGIIAANPVERVPLPKLAQAETVVLSETEARRLLRSTAGTRWHAAWWIMLAVGVRSGELRALTWDDVDLDTGRLRVWRSTSKPTRIGPTKGRRERWVPLPAPCVAALRRHRDIVASGAGVNQRGRRKDTMREPAGRWIFPSHITGRPYPSNTLWKHLRKALLAAGLPRIRPHDLRHSAATFMIARRRPLPIVAEILGHRSSSFTLSRYGHVVSSHYQDIADTMADVLSDPAPAAESEDEMG